MFQAATISNSLLYTIIWCQHCNLKELNVTTTLNLTNSTKLLVTPLPLNSGSTTYAGRHVFIISSLAIPTTDGTTFIYNRSWIQLAWQSVIQYYILVCKSVIQYIGLYNGSHYWRLHICRLFYNHLGTLNQTIYFDCSHLLKVELSTSLLWESSQI